MNKLIFVSDSIADIHQVKQFAKDNHYQMEYYSTREWRNNHFIKGASLGKKKHKTQFSIVPDQNSQNNFFNSLNEIQEDAIRQALILSEGNITKAAMILRIARATFYRKAKAFGIDVNSFRPEDHTKTQEKKAAA